MNQLVDGSNADIRELKIFMIIGLCCVVGECFVIRDLYNIDNVHNSFKKNFRFNFNKELIIIYNIYTIY